LRLASSPGGGTVYHTGFSFARAIGAGAFFGAGVTHVNGGGSLTYIGGSYTSFVITTIFAGVGGWSFQGSGSSTFIAVPQSRYAVTHNMVRRHGQADRQADRRGRMDGWPAAHGVYPSIVLS
jgi:hypothetical protein